MSRYSQRGAPLIEFTTHSRGDIQDLARAQLSSGHTEIMGRDRPDNLENLQSMYLRRSEQNSAEGCGSVSHTYPFLSAQLESLIPRYMDILFKELGITPGKDGIPSSYLLAEPLTISNSPNRGHYLAPFSVINESGKMKIMQHATSTLVHELVHAIGKMRMAYDENGTLSVRQGGLGIFRPHLMEENGTSMKPLFTYFDEAVTTLTQSHFLTNLMCFQEDRTWFNKPTIHSDKQLCLNGVDLTPALLATKILTVTKTPGKDPESEANISKSIKISFTRLIQGTQLSEQEASQMLKAHEFHKIRDREFLFHDSGYAVITHHMRILAHELFPDLSPTDAESAMHALLLRASMTGDLKPLTKQCREAFGEENATRYIKTLASFSNLNPSVSENQELVAFVCFVVAGSLPSKARKEVRDLIANAMLGEAKEAPNLKTKRKTGAHQKVEIG